MGILVIRRHVPEGQIILFYTVFKTFIYNDIYSCNAAYHKLLLHITKNRDFSNNYPT